MTGRVKIYNVGFIIFTIGSALTSLSLTPNEVIMFRAVQGLGASMLFTNSAALIADSTPAKELGLHLGINNLAYRFGAMAGLTLSGVILAFVDWRALFYINVPIGIFGTIWAYKRLKEVAEPERGTPFDWVGFATFTTSITSFLLALTYAAYGFGEADLVAVLSLVATGTLIAFVQYEKGRKFPLLDLDLLKIREFTGAVTAQLLNAITWGSMLLLLSLFLQLVHNQTPLQAGLELLPYEFAFLAVGPLSGRLSDTYGARAFTSVGLAVMSVALALMATMGPATPYLTVVYYEVLMGVGIGLFSSPNMSSVMGSVPSNRRGIASAFRAVFFNVGFTISLNLSMLIMASTIPYPVVSSIIASANPAAISTVDKGLFSLALGHAFIVMAIVNAVAIIPSIMRGKRTVSRVP
jgi:EmrB/QacA subfamily drug resistance transporter